MKRQRNNMNCRNTSPLGAHLRVGAGPRACPPPGQPQGVAPTAQGTVSFWNLSKPYGILLFLLLICPSLARGQGSFAGTWDTSFGRMTITHQLAGPLDLESLMADLESVPKGS